MTLVRKLARLDKAERWLLVEAAIVVPVVRLALMILPFRFVHRAVVSTTRGARRFFASQSQTPESIAQRVAAVAARVPRASCVTQALAASLLLARYGYPATLRIGVARNDDGTLRAHAWLESDGRTLFGGPDAGFVAFPPAALSRQ
jgi:hypothetical protein